MGHSAEDLASQILKNEGYVIIERNFRSRFGEIDLIATKGDALYFIEVKARSSVRYGHPEEAVTVSKLRKIQKTSEYYCLLHPNMPKKLRILVVAIIVSNQIMESYKIIDVY